MKIPKARYQHDVMGMPVFAAVERFLVNVSAENMKDAIAQDDENCAIALGCRRQLGTPYVSVGRARTDLALPHPDGVLKPDYGNTRWAVIRFKNSKTARELIIAADTEQLDPEGALVSLLPSTTDEPKKRKIRNKRQVWKKRTPRAQTDELTEMGVRILTGQRRR